MRYLWAAYRMGTDFEVPAGLSQEAFRDALHRKLQHVAEFFMLEATTARGKEPVAWLLNLTNGYHMEPHIVHFPWASPRNKLEVVLRFFHDMRRFPYSRVAILKIKDADKAFFDRVSRYGVIRRLCRVEDWWGPGKDAWFYQTKLLGEK